MSGRSKNAARQSFSVDESIYLLAESATVPSNAGMVQIFDLPQGVGSEFVGELRRSLLSGTDLPAVLRRRGRDPVGTVGLFRWIEVDDIDLSQHIRLSSLSGAGTEADLFAHVAALHSVRLDRHRPLWEFHLIEGLAGARFAVYFKMHHALGDGATVLRLLAGSLIGAENASGLPLFGADLDRDPLPPTAPVRQRVGGMAAARRRRTAARRRRRRPELNALRFCAPRTPFSVSIGAKREVAVRSWPLDRLKAVAVAHGTTLNDVLLAVWSGALRTYLSAAGALPTRPLVTAVPVSTRADGDDRAGNEVGMLLAELATDIADPEHRMAAIAASTARAKNAFAQLDRKDADAVMLANGVALGLQAVPGLVRLTGRAAVNLFISNVPGWKQPLYWNGARLSATYLLPLPSHQLPLIVTAMSYAGELHCTATCCPRSVPNLAGLMSALDDSLTALESRSVE